MQKTGIDIYQELERKVLPHVAHYQTDLTKHDFKQIVEDGYTGPFVFGYRRCGTNMIQLKPCVEDMTKASWLAQQTGSVDEIREELRRAHKENLIFITYSNEAFLHFDGMKFHICTKEQISKIYLDHIDKICDRWRINYK